MEQQDEQLIGIQEASKLLDCHPNTLRQWEKKGIVHAVRFGVRKDRRYRLQELQTLIQGKIRAEKIIYTGINDFRNYFLAIIKKIKKSDHYWAFAFNTEYFDPSIRKLLTKVHRQLAKRHIEDHALCKRENFPLIKKTYQGNTNIKLKAVSRDIPTGIIILKDRVAFLLWGSVPAIFEIKNTDVVKMYHQYFRELWLL